MNIGDIVKGLPEIENNSCDNIYSSHVLEHLSYEDMKMALSNTYNMLKMGGTFRFVIPDMEYFINEYLDNKKAGNKNACNQLMSATLMGEQNNIRGLKNKIIDILGNSRHQWNYDFDSMFQELQLVGFKNIRRAYFNDSTITDFIEIEDLGRWGTYCLGIVCSK
ncbi:MAG: methyltransferase domain-containing protein [Oligoflexus sp.]|nr:methyltransferase domain-containing protein [Pseudopedobacter sp.]